MTLHYDPGADELTVLRSKELAHDYRYFPEPDLVPIAPSAELIEELRAGLPELPAARVRRFEREYAAAARPGARPRAHEHARRLLRGGRGRLRRCARRRQLGAQRVLGAPQRGAPDRGCIARQARRPGGADRPRGRRHARLVRRQDGVRRARRGRERRRSGRHRRGARPRPDRRHRRACGRGRRKSWPPTRRRPSSSAPARTP